MRVLLISQYFSPEPGFRLQALTTALAAAGHSVTVLTGFPNFPAGKVYPGYRIRWRQRERLDQADVLRVPLWPYRGNRTPLRVLNFGSFALCAAIAVAAMDDYDVVYAYHPPLTTAIPAVFAARKMRAPLIYDVQDIWPEAGVVAGAIRRGFFYNAMTVLANWAYRNATRVTVIAESFRRLLMQQGVPAEKLMVVPNWPDERIFRPRPSGDVRERLNLPGDAFLVVYAGNVGSTHGVEHVIEAAALLRDTPDVFVVIAGAGPELQSMKDRAATRKLTNIRFTGFLSTDDMVQLINTAQLMLVHLRSSPLGAVSLPSRITSYMACAKPILVASEGAPREQIEAAQCGVGVEPENAQAMADAIRALKQQPARLAEMGQAGKHYADANLSEQVVVSRLVGLMEELGLASETLSAAKANQ
jgi:glycosyltransferase involved in cell wall biosynthesis